MGLARNLLLRGGRKDIRAKIVRGREIGSGGEAEVYETRVILSSRARGTARERVLAEKRFYPQNRPVQHFPPHDPFGNPRLQFEIARELIGLNRKLKLGLNLPSTIRLAGRGRNASLFMTLYPGVVPDDAIHSMGSGPFRKFRKDLSRQLRILEQHGYNCQFAADAAIPQVGADGKVRAVITDFGNIVRKSHLEKHFSLDAKRF